jgi:hypothetical protein
MRGETLNPFHSAESVPAGCPLSKCVQRECCLITDMSNCTSPMRIRIAPSDVWALGGCTGIAMPFTPTIAPTAGRPASVIAVTKRLGRAYGPPYGP